MQRAEAEKFIEESVKSLFPKTPLEFSALEMWVKDLEGFDYSIAKTAILEHRHKRKWDSAVIADFLEIASKHRAAAVERPTDTDPVLHFTIKELITDDMGDKKLSDKRGIPFYGNPTKDENILTRIRRYTERVRREKSQGGSEYVVMFSNELGIE